jgi:predicted acetyltransferase
MSLVSTEYRLLTLDDLEQAAVVEARAFYNTPSPEYAERMRKYFPPEWTVGAFVDGKLVADTRTVPQVRRMHGTTMLFGAVGPVACAAPYRRQGHVNKLLTLALETMRERGQVLSGLHTPHDALYQRFGWERGERKTYIRLKPKDVRLRERGARGRMEAVATDDWPRLDAIFKEATKDENGPFVRRDVWWQEAVLKHWEQGKTVPSEAIVWVDAEGRDQGYVVYWDASGGRDPHGPFERNEIWVHHYYALTPDAYLGIWEHLLTHDLAHNIIAELHPDDPFQQLCDPPQAVEASGGWGAMIRVVDVENAIAQRPYVGDRAAAVTVRIEDKTLPFNDGTWRIEASEDRMHAERTDARPDAGLSVNTLASLFTGFLKADAAALSGFIRTTSPETIDNLGQLFAVTRPPFCPDHY